MKWVALHFDDPGLVLPGAITATGRSDDGPFTLVMGPYTGNLVFLTRRGGTVFRSVSARQSDSPERPETPIKDADALVARALTNAKPKELTSLNRRWHGQWTGRLVFNPKPVVELDRTISGAKIAIRSMQAFAWRWTVTLGKETKDGTATQLRDAVSYARAATRELIAFREANRATGERKDAPRDRLDRAAARSWTRDRVKPKPPPKGAKKTPSAPELRRYKARIATSTRSWDITFEARDADAALRHAQAVAEDWATQHGRMAHAEPPKAMGRAGVRA